MLDLLEAPGGYDTAPPSDLRRCSRCGELKAVDEFPIKVVRTGRRRTWCLNCCRAYGREHYEKNRDTYLKRNTDRRKVERPKTKALIDAYLREHPCADCGRSDITVLEFDHRDPTNKDSTVGALARNAEWPRVLSEIQKCDVRCANCHRRRTAQQFNWAKVRGVRIEVADVRPGTAGRYSQPVAVCQDALWSSHAHGLRRCSRCRQLKSLTEFPFRDLRAGVRGHYCRPCQAAYRREHYERNKPDYIRRAMNEVRMKREDALLRLHDYLRSHPCVECGEADITVLEFDHVDPAMKLIHVGTMVGRRGWATITAEIAKCVVRCANCHRRRTAQQQGWKARLAELGGGYVRIRSLAGVA